MMTPVVHSFKWAILYQGSVLRRFQLRHEAEQYAFALKRLVKDVVVEICWLGGDDV
ncbi:MAG: hypothetical protein SAJ72_09290 [Jaaginema sp. PMC 1080.18]|nr:hypothetical protein [Jaaginema sp. PMC 1080.18]